MSEFTPGPWEVGMRGGHNANTIFDRSGKGKDAAHYDNSIASVFGIPSHKGVEELGSNSVVGLANAILIASAPELLEALKQAVSMLEVYTGCSDGCTCGDDWTHVERHEIEPLRAAIAKATGGQE